jgi:hypothetical protein
MGSPGGKNNDAHKWNKWSAIGTIASAVIAFVALYGVFKSNEPSVNKAKVDQSVTQNDGSVTQNITNIIKVAPQTGSPGAQKTDIAPAMIRNDNLWSSGQETDVVNILKSKGGKNISKISATLVLSAPERLPNGYLQYCLTLTMEVVMASSKRSCGPLTYHDCVETDVNDTKEHIVEQAWAGHDGILMKLQNEAGLPSCLTL